MADKEELDRIVFCDILGLSKSEMKEAREALAEIVRRRIERPLISGKTVIAEDDKLEVDEETP